MQGKFLGKFFLMTVCNSWHAIKPCLFEVKIQFKKGMYLVMVDCWLMCSPFDDDRADKNDTYCRKLST